MKIGEVLLEDNHCYVFSVTPAELSLVDDSLKAMAGKYTGRSGRTSHKYFVFSKDASEEEAKPENTLAVVSALPFMIADPDSYYYTPAWVITMLEVNRNLKESAFGSVVLEYIATFLKSTTRSSEIFISVETESVCDILCCYSKLWETTSETDCPTLYNTYTMHMSSTLDNAERAVIVRKIKGLYSFNEKMAEISKIFLTAGKIQHDKEFGPAVHSYTVPFYSDSSRHPRFYVGGLTFKVAPSMLQYSKITFEIDYMPERTEEFKKIESAENYTNVICTAIENIALLYKNDNNIVTCYTTEKDIMKCLQERMWKLTPSFALEYKAGTEQVVG